MAIVFFCQSCGARFEVAPRLAGKKGRCKTCGQVMHVPKAEELASMSSMPALAASGERRAAAAAIAAAVPVARASTLATAGRRGAASGGGKPQSMNDWLDQSLSKIGLAPLSRAAIPKKPFLPSALDDAEDSKPYVLEKPDRRSARGKGGGPPNAVVVAWRKEISLIHKIFRWLNQSAYLASVPFIVILLFGIAVKVHGISIFGATFVVLLNIGRIVAGIADLAVIPLRDGLSPAKLKKPVRRVVEPIATIAAVWVAFAFIPWLRYSEASTGTITDRLRSTAKGLESDIKSELGTVTDKAKTLELDKLGAQAQEKLRGAVEQAKSIDLNKLGAQAQDKLKGLQSSPGAQTEKPPPQSADTQPSQGPQVRELLKDVQRGREALKELQKDP